MVLITGYSGIGKTALVEESVATSRSCGPGALAQGKFDQYSRDTPFKAVTAAMQVNWGALMRTLLVLFALFALVLNGAEIAAAQRAGLRP